MTVAKDFYVINESGEIIIEHDDLFRAMDKLKLEPPGSKLIRASDKATLAYTTSPKDFDIDGPPRRRKKRRLSNVAE